jgi:hypothetical protein
MGELRLYAIGIEEVHDMFGAPPELAERLRAQADAALAPPPATERSGWLSRLGPIFRRVPGAPVLSPDDPRPADLERILTGDYVPADRILVTWQLLELLIKENSWGTTRLWLEREQLDTLDFALARGGVHAAAGLWHLLHNQTELPLFPPQGTLIGYHPFDQVAWMADSYRAAMPEIKGADQREQVQDLADWMDGFAAWSGQAAAVARPGPDLVAYWDVS